MIKLDIYIFPKGEDDQIDRRCLKCSNGSLKLNIGKFGAFVGCSNYPECDYRRSIFENQDETQDSSSEYPQVIGRDPSSGEEILIKKGPYGLYLECDGKRSTIPKGMARGHARNGH